MESTTRTTLGWCLNIFKVFHSSKYRLIHCPNVTTCLGWNYSMIATTEHDDINISRDIIKCSMINPFFLFLNRYVKLNMLLSPMKCLCIVRSLSLYLLCIIPYMISWNVYLIVQMPLRCHDNGFNHHILSVEKPPSFPFINSSSAGQIVPHFTNSIFKCIFWVEMYEFRWRFHWSS